MTRIQTVEVIAVAGHLPNAEPIAFRREGRELYVLFSEGATRQHLAEAIAQAFSEVSEISQLFAGDKLGRRCRYRFRIEIEEGG